MIKWLILFILLALWLVIIFALFVAIMLIREIWKNDYLPDLCPNCGRLVKRSEVGPNGECRRCQNERN